MDRLTGWDDEHAYCLQCFKGGGCEGMDTSRCDFCDHHIAVYDRLAAYEDTGLTPERVKELSEAKVELLSLGTGRNSQERSKMTRFSVIDNRTGAYPDCEEIALAEEWAKHLMYCDIAGFYTGEDGGLVLVDDCGNAAFCPACRFEIVLEEEGDE